MKSRPVLFNVVAVLIILLAVCALTLHYYPPNNDLWSQWAYDFGRPLAAVIGTLMFLALLLFHGGRRREAREIIQGFVALDSHFSWEAEAEREELVKQAEQFLEKEGCS